MYSMSTSAVLIISLPTAMQIYVSVLKRLRFEILVSTVDCIYHHQFACLYFFYTVLLLFSQGVLVEFLCRAASAGFDLDVCGTCHNGQALHPLSDPLCCL